MEITKKMVVLVYQNNELVNTWENQESIMNNLMAFLWQKAVLKSDLKVRYNYDYSDKQSITFSKKYTNYDDTITTFKYVFKNIPTNLGYLDTYVMSKLVKGE